MMQQTFVDSSCKVYQFSATTTRNGKILPEGNKFMLTLLAIITLLVLVLAWANGANDVPKGVATLVGNGSAGTKRAILWGTLWTILGGIAAVIWGSALIKMFSSGYTSPGFNINLTFITSTLLGAASWVLFATRFGLPVSTTHALLGGLVGAVLVSAGPQGLLLEAVTNKAFVPLLVSPLIAIGLCSLLIFAIQLAGKRIPRWVPGCCSEEDWRQNPFNCAETNGRQRPPPVVEKIWLGLHWFSSGITSFARALNDVPKIAAFLILAISLAPGLGDDIKGIGPMWPILAVSLSMAGGALWGGYRVLGVMSEHLTRLDAGSGTVANVGTSLLVLAASPLGIPVSTTHVSTGSLMGVRWINKAKPQRRDALRLVLYGWVITLPIAAVIAAGSSWLIALI
jgi:PiT family inorganic phosphate transporter